MRRLIGLASVVFAILTSAALHAQVVDPAKLQVRTFMLQNLSPDDAAKLVAPYVTYPPGGGVYEAGGAVKAITVRGTAETLTRVDSLLRANDRARLTVVFRFQLIAASDSAVRDPAIAGVDAELRNLFRFAGYRLLSQGTAMVNEQENFALTMSGAEGELVKLSGELWAVQMSAGKGTAHVRVTLERVIRSTMVMPAGSKYGDMTLLSTGLTVPLGQTVVLGSAAYGPQMPAIILAVRPELAQKP